MILILDNLLNNYLNILSCLIIISIFNLTKEKFIILFFIDILLNKIPITSITILLLYFLNSFIFKRIVRSNINIFILSIIYMFLFLSFIYLFYDNNYTYIYFFKKNIISFILNIVIYYVYFFHNENYEIEK